MSAVAAPTFVTLPRLASRVGLPAAWLRAEAEAGRLPHLRIGRFLRFDPKAVELALTARAAVERPGGEADVGYGRADPGEEAAAHGR